MDYRAIDPPHVCTRYSEPILIVAYWLQFYEGAWCLYQEYKHGGWDLTSDYDDESEARREFDKLTGR